MGRTVGAETRTEKNPRDKTIEFLRRCISIFLSFYTDTYRAKMKEKSHTPNTINSLLAVKSESICWGRISLAHFIQNPEAGVNIGIQTPLDLDQD